MNRFNITFNDGPKVIVEGDDPEDEYTVTFIDTKTENIVYQHPSLKLGQWCAANAKYYVPWRVIVEGKHGKVDYTLNLKDQDVLIVFESKSLGDNVAWIPFVEEFRKIHECKVTVMTFWNDLFVSEYPDLNFRKHADTNLPTFRAIYRVGAYDNDYNKNKQNWHLIPLQQIASDLLGIPYREIRPKVKRSTEDPPLSCDYVTFTEFSTWYAKMWSRPKGWHQLVDKVTDAGFKAVSISKETSHLPNAMKRNGKEIEETIRYIQHSKMFIGVSCGPSVLAWALGVPVCIISNSTEPWSEFKDCIRIFNREVCHGCFNDVTLPVDRGNWKFCPRGKEFECSNAVTPDMVWDAIRPALLPTKEKPFVQVKHTQKVLYIIPHCSTGGGPQYILRCIEELRKSGHEVAVAEYRNISDHYVVQKNRIRALVPFHTMNGNKTRSIAELMDSFKPDIVHIQCFPEWFMEEETSKYLYRQDRDYTIIETNHGAGWPEPKTYKPDKFIFVSKHHMPFAEQMGIPAYIADYPIEYHNRPDRVEALAKLGLDPAKRHILNVGLFAPHKNQGFVMEVARRMPDTMFHFVGNQADNFRPYWEPICIARTENCTIWQERDDVDKFYAAMDALLFPSTNELNPLVVKEAIGWGMPAYIHRLDTYAYLYEQNPLVTFIDINDPDAVADLLTPKGLGYDLRHAYRS